MKLLALLFLVGFAAATGEWEWVPGKEYEFEYHGRLLTGFPKLASHYSGIGMRAQIIVKVQESDRLVLSIHEPEYVRINNVLRPKENQTVSYGIEGTNWRNLELPPMEQIPQEHKQLLARPLIIRLSFSGEIKEVIVSKDEPEWVINFKKGIALLFQTKIDKYSRELEENQLEESYYGNKTSTWKVKEESLDGLCLNEYNVYELPKYIVKEQPELVPYPEACEGNIYYKIIKQRNIDTCEKRSVYSFYKPGYFNCRGETGANCSPMWNHVSNINYIACRSKLSSHQRASNKFVIQTIINEAEIQSSLHGYKSERITTGTKQILKLRAIRSVSDVPLPKEPRTLTSLLYEWDREDIVHGGLVSDSILSRTNRDIFMSGIVEARISDQEIKTQIIELLKEVAGVLKLGGEQGISDSHINMKLLGVSRGFTMLKSVPAFKEIFSQISGDETMKNLFFDTVTMSGTPAAVEFMKEVILSGNTNSIQTGQFFMWIPHHLVLPTEGVLKNVFEIVRSQKIQESRIPIRSLAISGFSRIINLACISHERLNSYPTWVYGEFCSPNSNIVQGEWIPFLAEQLKTDRSSNHKNIIIMAMGTTGHRSIIPHLLPIVEGYGAEEYPITSRLLAIYSLTSVGRREPSVVIPILLATLKNPAESHNVRIAAFNGIMVLNPSSTVLHQIAGMTHQEPTIHLELLKVINTAFFTIGHEKIHPNMDERARFMIKNARSAYHLIRKTKDAYLTSASLFFNTYLQKLDVGYESFLTYVQSQEHIVPRRFYWEMKYLLTNFNVKAFQFGYWLNEGGDNSFYSRLRGLMGNNKENIQEKIQKYISEGINSEWKKMVEQFQDLQSPLEEERYESVSDRQSYATFFLRVFESSPIYFSLDSYSVGLVKEKLLPAMLTGTNINGHKIEYQRTTDVSPFKAIIPSDMGLPIHIRLHSPITVSFVGELNAALSAESQSLEVAGKFAYDSQVTGYVGTISPFTQEYIYTGVDQHTVVDLPGSLKVKLDGPAQKLVVDISKLDTAQDVDVLHFNVLPFTVIDRLNTLRPLIKSQNLKPIRSEKQPTEKHIQFGEYLGLNMKLKYKTESMYAGRSNVMEIFRMYKCPANLALFSWISPAISKDGMPSIRNHMFTAVLGNSGSATKEIRMEFAFGFASKYLEGPIRYHRLEAIREKEDMLENLAHGYENPLIRMFKENLPYRILSEPLESITLHPKRVEKLRELMQVVDEQGQGANVQVTLMLVGSRPRSFTYSLSLGTGMSQETSKKIVQKWNVRLERESSKLCISGHVKLPVLPLWNVNDLTSTLSSFDFKNIIGIGQGSCQETEIITEGHFASSNNQVKYGLKSFEAKECHRLFSGRYKAEALTMPVCSMTRQIATTVDTVKFTNTFKNVGQYGNIVERKVIEYLKTFLWPYLVVDKSTPIGAVTPSNYKTIVKVGFHQDTPSYDLEIIRPDMELKFDTVHIRYPYRLFFPLKSKWINPTTYGINFFKEYMQPIGYYQENLYSASEPRCTATSEGVTNYASERLPYKSHSCEHLITGDCGHVKHFFITEKITPNGQKKVKIVLRDAKIEIVGKPMRLYVDGAEIPLKDNYFVNIKDRKDRILGTVFKTLDKVVSVKLPSFYLDELNFDGEVLVVYPNPSLKGKNMCGICGAVPTTYELENTLERTPFDQTCGYSTPELFLTSHRVESSECSGLDVSIRKQIKHEKEMCEYNRQSGYNKGFRVSSEQCSVLRHIVIEHSKKVCISKMPVVHCGTECRSEGHVNKPVPFVCLPKGRLSDYYLDKVEAGKTLSELSNMEESFVKNILQVRQCIQAGSTLY